MRECVPSQYLQGYCAHALHPTRTRRQRRQRQHHISARREHSSAARTHRHTARERQREAHAQRVRCSRAGQQKLTTQMPPSSRPSQHRLTSCSTRLSQHRLTTHNRTFVHCANAQSNHRTFVHLLLEQTLQPFKALKSFKKLAKKIKKVLKKT